MKRIHYISLFAFSLMHFNESFSQGANCSNMGPICTNAGLNFTAQTGVTDAFVTDPGNDYGCLGDAPNPSWYYLEISANGDIEMELSAPNDIDFAIWGPFSSLANAQANCNSYGAPIDGFGGTFCSTLDICDFNGCSYSTAATEYPGIENAQVGEVYVMLITNYDNSVQNITLSQTGGGGATDCSIVTNDPCTIDNMTAAVTNCYSTPFLEFDVGGTISFTDPPTTGDLIVQDCYGFQYVVASAPFGTSATYSITALPQDGASCDLTAFFSDDNGCTYTTPIIAPSPIVGFSSNCVIGGGAMDGTIEFSNGHTGANLIVEISDGTNTIQDIIPMPASSPQNWSVSGLDPAANPYTITYYFDDNAACSQTQTVNCGCSADGGTGTSQLTGDGINNYILCENDQIDIFTAHDYTAPDDVGPIGGYAYIPALAYLVYSCPPTPGVFPGDDPCFEGIVPIVDDLTDINDGVSIFQQLGGAGTFTDQELFYTPITLYHYDPAAPAYIVNSNCWDIGDITQVTYLNPIVDVVTPDCQTGSVEVQLSGGFPEIYGGNFTASNISPANASFDNTTCAHNGTISISGLLNGDMYSFDVVDENGCPITISGGPFVGVPTADAGTDDTECSFTYALSATPSYGTGSWSGPGGVTFSNASSPTSNVTVTSAGTYDFTWTEDNGGGCVDSDIVTITFSNIDYNDNVTQSTCGNADGEIILSGTNGIAPYSYSIDNGATSQANGTFSSLGANTYNIVVTDNIGCDVTDAIQITDLGGPTIDNVSGVDLNCNGVCAGSIAISATGATQFSIDNGATFQGTSNFNNLCAGSYDILVEDNLGCSTSDNITLTEPDPLTHSTSKVDLVCANQCDGVIDITEGGGTAPYQYSIDNGATNQSNGLFQNLCGGTYDIVVTDGNNCSVTSQVTLTEPTPLTVTIGITDATCFGQCNGMMNSIPAGGTGPGTYNYSWSPAVGGNVPLVTDLCAGSYDLTITDGNGCSIDSNGIVVGAPAPVTIDNVIEVDETCGGDCTGSITIDAAGATSYSIDGVTYGASNIFSNLCAGNYTVYAEDANGCAADAPAVIDGPSPVQIIAGGDATICNGGNAPLTSNATGGVGNYTYQWDDANNSTTQNISVSPTNTQSYCVTTTDGNGCQSSPACVTVSLHPALSVIALSDQDICEGDAAFITAVGSGGNGGPYTYTWNQNVGNGANQSVSPNFTTTYTVTVEDNCETPSATADVTITVNTIPNISFEADNFDGCYPVDVNFTEINVPAGSQCLWSFGDGGATTDCSNVNYSFENPGCWDVTLDITTPDGCQATSTITDYICVYDYPQPEFSFGPQPTTTLEPTISFFNETNGNNTYNWSFDTQGVNESSTQTNPTYTFPDAGTYQVCLDAVSSEGCPGQACDEVQILEEFLVYVPNAFTPDGDEVNNEFMPIISGVMPDTYEFLVFNRWGELIFQSQIVGVGWDGTYKGLMSQQDVYVWKLKVDDQLGKTHSYIGHVTLIK